MEYLIKVSAILILFYACYKLFLNRETFFESNRSFLLLGLITAFILPLIVIPKYIEVEPTIMESNFVFGTITSISEPVVVDSSIHWTTVLSYTYLAGILFFFGRFMFQFASLISLIINSTKQRMAPYIYVITKNALSPFSFFNWIVFNPKHFNKTELEQIIEHEKVHAKQLHSIDIIIVELTCIALWFNPLVWLYKKDVRQNLEFIADKNAQATTQCKKSYQHLLLKTSAPNYQMALTNNFYNSLIKKRIVMLQKNKSHNRNQLKYLLMLPALAIFLMSFNSKEIYIEKARTNQASSPVLELNDFESSTIETNVNVTNTLPKTRKKTATKTSKIENAIEDLQSVITKDMTDNELDAMVTNFKKDGITLKFSKIKRNKNDEIIAIAISVKSKNSNTNFHQNHDEGILPITITVHENSISIGNGKDTGHRDYIYKIKDGKVAYSHNDSDTDVHIITGSGGKLTKLKPSNSKGIVYKVHPDNNETDNYVYSIKSHSDSLHDNSFFELKSAKIKGDTLWNLSNDNVFILGDNKIKGVRLKRDHDKVLLTTDTLQLKGRANLWVKDSINGKIWTKDSGKTSLWIGQNSADEAPINIGSTSNTLFISGNSEKALFIIDDKEVSKKDFDKLDTDNIISVNILKGDEATKQYGAKGKDGVIIITTKKKKD